jgi:uncharacterized protein
MVGSAEIAARNAVQLGGRPRFPSTDIPSGRSALIADPQGAVFAVLQVSRSA